jgi:hypothetical protein
VSQKIKNNNPLFKLFSGILVTDMQKIAQGLVLRLLSLSLSQEWVPIPALEE